MQYFSEIKAALEWPVCLVPAETPCAGSCKVYRDKGLNLLLQYVTARYRFLPMSEQT